MQVLESSICETTIGKPETVAISLYKMFKNLGFNFQTFAKDNRHRAANEPFLKTELIAKISLPHF